MSIRAIQAVLDHSPQPPHLKFLLTIIANSENEGTGRCDPGVPKLAFYLNCTERNVRKKFDPLVACGELVIEGREGDSSQYYIPLYPHEVGYYDPGPCQDTHLHRCNGHHGPIVSRAKIALDNNPRYQQRRNHSSGVPPEPQFRGTPGTTVQGGDEPQFRGGGTTVQGTPEPQFSQTGIEPEILNRKKNRNTRVSSSNQKQKTEPETAEIVPLAPRHTRFYDWLERSGYRKVPGQGMKAIEHLQFEDAQYRRMSYAEVCAAYETAQRQGVAI